MLNCLLRLHSGCCRYFKPLTLPCDPLPRCMLRDSSSARAHREFQKIALLMAAVSRTPADQNVASLHGSGCPRLLRCLQGDVRHCPPAGYVRESDFHRIREHDARSALSLPLLATPRASTTKSASCATCSGSCRTATIITPTIFRIPTAWVRATLLQLTCERYGPQHQRCAVVINSVACDLRRGVLHRSRLEREIAKCRLPTTGWYW